MKGTLREAYIHFDHISLSFSYNDKCSRQTLYRKSKQTFCIQYPFPENCAVYEMWKNMVKNKTSHRRQYSTTHALCVLDK